MREHGASPNPRALGKPCRAGRIETGMVHEQKVSIEDETGQPLMLRRIELDLDEPTEDRDSVIVLLTNLPKSQFTARKIARLYRRRWHMGNLFQRLESVLYSEVSLLERVHDLPTRVDNAGMRKPYASDISREKFEEILPVLQSVRKRTKPTTVDLYEVFCAVLYLLRNGCQWRMLPRDFPKWRTVHSYFAKWSEPDQHGMSVLERALKKSGWRGPRETGAQRQADALDRGRPEREEHGYGR